MVDFKKDKNIKPIDENLSVVLGDSFSAYKLLLEKLPAFEINLEWRFYKDGGWLAKATRERKTIFWGQPEVGFFTIAAHFNEKNKQGVFDLNISDELKEAFSNASISSNQFTTLKIDIYNEKDLTNVYQLIEYKKAN